MSAFKTFIFGMCFLMPAISVAQVEHPVVEKKSWEDRQAAHAEFNQYLKDNGMDGPPPIRVDNASRLSNSTRMLGVLEVLSNNQSLLNQLDLVGEQAEMVGEITERYRSAKQHLGEKLEGVGKAEQSHLKTVFGKECKVLCKELSELLADSQSEQLLNTRMGRGGLIGVLSEENLVSKHVGLSESQKEGINEKYAELAKEIEEFIKLKRKEASEIFEDELTDEQKKRLVEFFGSDRIRSNFESASSETFLRRSGMDTSEMIGPKLEIWKEIEETIADDN